MLNSTKHSKNPRDSKFLGNRRKRFSTHSQKEMLVLPDVPGVSPADKKAEIYCKIFKEGFYQVRFKCSTTGRTAIGYGKNITLAMENIDKDFTEKYL